MNDFLSRLNPRVKRWCFRLFAILIGMLPFIVLEVGFIIADVGRSDQFVDPFVEFSQIHPLFELDPQQEKMVIAPSRREFFAHAEFPVEKAPGTFRIFCLGGSTVQGRPYSIQTSFPTWLKIGLKVAEPEKNWEVINCGGVSYASYRLLPIMQECLNYQPDLFILCTGHNEFLEDRSYENIKNTPAWIRRSVNQISQLRTVSVVSSIFESEQNKPVLAADADAILNYKNGLAAYHRDLDWNKAVAEHFDLNVRRMIKLSKKAGVPLLLMLPPSNLSGSAPFKSESEGLSQQEKKLIQTMKEEARSLYQSDLPQAAKVWKEICSVDKFFAMNHYESGKCLELLNRYDEARKEFQLARDLDVCALRMTRPLIDAMEQVAIETQTPFLNLHQILEQRTSSFILGDRWLVDHVHPNFEGHQQIAFTIGRWLEEQGVVKLSKGWESDCQPIFNQHFESLDRSYFHKGQRALRGLQLWTQGNADGPPVEDKFSHLLNQE